MYIYLPLRVTENFPAEISRRPYGHQDTPPDKNSKTLSVQWRRVAQDLKPQKQCEKQVLPSNAPDRQP